jgi:hypothetical protein
MANAKGRYAALTQRLVDTVVATPGATSSDLRRAIVARTAHLGEQRPDRVPAPLAAYADKVALQAYRVTDGEVADLQRAGSSEDALFEVTVSAALGAALGRLDRGLAALRGEEPD